MIKRYSKLLSGLLFVVIAAVMFYGISTMKTSKLGSDPRLFPMVVACLFLILGIPQTIIGLLEYRDLRKLEPLPPMSRTSLVRILLSLLFLGIFIFVLPWIGFVLSGILYLLAMFFLFSDKENRKPLLFVAISVIFPLICYLMFVKGFRVILPTGRYIDRLMAMF